MRPLLKRKKQYEVVEMDKEWMVLDLEAYTITTLNEVGSFCWSILHEDKSLEDMVEMVAEEYRMEPRDVEHDVTLFINKMKHVGLIEHVS
ncbi:PqqD family peptide modification chaperone [Halobacillus litoralis]|uniref:PqqD family peptide modification chaperone n=1 Tax=Halobacillus litoralis TaxID=45668 RepID=A0A845F888_9BACI|nr:PqqD family protein [Halobacillus litoralis]MYL69926.1 PqqD family peptide modification chaperone [Halobacillus litoralis]